MRRTRYPLFPSSHSSKRPWLRNIIRWALYALCILMAFLFANIGDYTKPLLLLPISLCISSVSGPIISGSIGIVCGLLMDISSGTLPGYHAILLFLICMLTSLLYDKLMMQRFFNLLFFTAVTAFIVTGSDYIFRYAIWGYDNVSQVYLHYMLPCLLYTCISSAVIYPIFSCIHRFFLPQRRRTIEKTLRPLEDR